MRTSSIITLLVAVSLGLLAVFALNRQSAAPVPVTTVDVVAAKSDIPRGMVLTSVMLEIRKVSKEAVTEGAITQIAAAEDRMLLDGLSKGEVVYEKRLAPKGQRGVATQIKEGMRAYTIETPRDSNSVSGLLMPGNHVDVILNLTAPLSDEWAKTTGGGTTLTLLQNIEVLAVDNRYDAAAAPSATGTGIGAAAQAKALDYKAVTLLVTPEQASMLTLGQSRGTLHLSLRNPNDTTLLETPPTLLRDIQSYHSMLAGIGPPPIAAEKPAIEPKKEEPEPEKKVTVPPKPKLSRIRVLKGQFEETVIHQSMP